MRRVLHDFSDSKCREILQNQKSAMKRAHSKLLVCETVLPKVGCSGFESLVDISRITFSSMQRSDKQWTALLGVSGCRSFRFGRRKGGPFTVIEAEVD